MNIRAEQRESRDLIQDMEDIRSGIKVQHASDKEKRQKAEKSQRRSKAKQTKIHRLEKKLLDVGYQNMESHSLDRIHADKWLGEQRIQELEALRFQQEQEQKIIPQQITIADFMTKEAAS